MIAELTGTVSTIYNRFVVLNVNGVGYKVAITVETLEKIRDKKEHIRLLTHLIVREDALDLYGFLSREELEFFELLITISGIGPKTALSILNLATIATLKKAVSTGDATYLTKVSGVGKKNAEKIVLELKDKLAFTMEDGEDAARTYEDDSLEALKALGYPERDARDALKKVPKDITDTVECVKQALKILAKTK